MKTVTKSSILAMSLAVLTTLTGCGNSQEPPDTTQPIETQPAVTTLPLMTAPATTTEPDPKEDPEYVPDMAEFTENVFDNLAEMTSFEMNYNIKGFIPGSTYMSDNSGDMIEHNFTLTTTTTSLHLISNTKNLNTNEKSEYEEYQVLEDNIVTTLTKSQSGKWSDVTPKDMIRYDMMTKSFTSLPLIGIFANSPTDANDAFANCSEIERDENGNYIVTIKDWDIPNYNSEFGMHGFSGLFRSTQIHDILANSSLEAKDGDCIYVFDKNFTPVSISFDIYNPNNYNADYYGLDLHGDVKFTKWNEINEIYLPKVNSPVNETEITNDAGFKPGIVSEDEPFTTADSTVPIDTGVIDTSTETNPVEGGFTPASETTTESVLQETEAITETEATTAAETSVPPMPTNTTTE